MPHLPLPALNDPEGSRIPDSLPFVVDAHVHLFPDALFSAIWSWFARFGWPIRYQLGANELIEFLLARGVGHLVGLHYAHRPGIARGLNAYMAELCRNYPQVTGLATVFPGEEDAADILRDALQAGLAGVKLHAHVQSFEMDSPGMQEVYGICAEYDKPLVIHAGREPKNPDFPYPRDPYLICAAEKVEAVLRDYPNLRICVPHLGADEFDAYRRLLERYDNLWLDTTMVYADYLPVVETPRLADFRSDRVMYGTDFPNIPYAWDRELNSLMALGLSADSLENLLGRNAVSFFGLPSSS